MPAADLNHLGTIALADLTTICRQQGREGPPYPLFTPPDAVQHAAPTATLDTNHTGPIWSWANAWTTADIWISSRVIPTDRSQPAIRIAACRAGDHGYLGIQRPPDTGTEPTVDAYALSAYHLAAAITNNIKLTGPGSRPQITVPGYTGRIPGSNQPLPSTTTPSNDHPHSVLTPLRTTAHPTTTICDTDVTATGVLQTRSTPPPTWGIDWTAPLITWIHITEDGDYLYTPNHHHATPADTHHFTTRINQHIATDITTLRHARGLG